MSLTELNDSGDAEVRQWLTQCCTAIPGGGGIISLAYLGAQLATGCVWMLRSNDFCANVLGGCDWGDAASCNLGAQIAYVAAAFFHQFMPDPRGRGADAAPVEANTNKERKLKVL